MNKIISDAMWNEIKDLIPDRREGSVGRPRADKRKILEGMFYILITGAQWSKLPNEYGPPSTVHGWMRIWTDSGLFQRIRNIMATRYLKKTGMTINWLSIDTSYSKAPFATFSGKNPTDRGRMGVKKSIVVDWNGAPLAAFADAANKHDVKFLEPTLANFFQYNQRPDKPVVLTADSAFDSKQLRKSCAKNNIALLAANNVRRSKNQKLYKPGHRWVVERTFGWMSWFRGLKTCWVKKIEMFLAFLDLALIKVLFRMGGIFE
jgi:putative transposase